MNEIIKKRMSESVGKEIKIFLNNGFRFAGKVTNCDEKYIEILDYVSKAYKIIDIDQVNNIEVQQ
jgi:sRNA-binding regulator protein Hfq